MIKKTFSININLASEVTIHQTYFYHFSVAKFLKGFNNGMYTGMNLIDLQKAFDTTKLKTLIDKLLPIGFSKNSISRYESFLAECHFTVEFANWVSKFTNISCDVLQVLILGPIPFFFYINYMSQTVECNLYLYADDSCLLL